MTNVHVHVDISAVVAAEAIRDGLWDQHLPELWKALLERSHSPEANAYWAARNSAVGEAIRQAHDWRPGQQVDL